jgi:hypothetical protein
MHCREPVHSSQFPASSRFACHLLIGASLLAVSAVLLAGGATANDQIDALLDAAEAAERRDHLIYPARGSAMSLYHEVLFLDPENPHALEGLVRLAEHYLEAAQAALDKDRLLKAGSLVSKARMIHPDYPAVEAMQRKIEMLESASRTRVTLDWRLVADRSPELTDDLTRLGRLAKSGDCRVTINVGNDSEGRWIYRSMNAAGGDGRLRAEVKIASPSAVEVICFEARDEV